jgi:ribosomal protein L11 methyltransferase
MNHIQVTITATPEKQELLIAQLAEIGFEGFEETETALNAFISEEQYDKNVLQDIVSQFNAAFDAVLIPKQNWNEVWESNFQPVIVDDFVGVRAHFHQPISNVEHEIVITPKMSFGTGHHATTYMVMQLMREIDFQQKSVFDFGSGTGILAILAEKLGANEILAVDNDEWCIENATENVQNNFCTSIKIQLVNTAELPKQYDIVIANINKNIILDNLSFLQADVVFGGTVMLSGLLAEDETDILQATQPLGWVHQKTLHKGMWIAMLFKA